MNDDYQTMIEETKTETKIIPAPRSKYTRKTNDNRGAQRTQNQLSELNNNISKLNLTIAKEAKMHNTKDKRKRKNGTRAEIGGAGGYMSKSNHSYSDGFGTPYNVMVKKAMDFNKGKMPRWFNRLS